VIDVEVK